VDGEMHAILFSPYPCDRFLTVDYRLVDLTMLNTKVFPGYYLGTELQQITEALLDPQM
jgi:hypothetical protein